MMTNDQSQNDEILEITYYTDPICCWSWAFEPQWRRLRYEFDGKIKWRYRMGGMLPDWESYDDPMNSVSRPVQMGPVWLEAKHISGMPMDDKVWFFNPPASSYPACIAVKCAGLQSPEAEELYLRSIREAIMLNGKNIGSREVLIETAENLAHQKPKCFSSERFIKDLDSNAGNEAFKNDLEKARYYGIGRYPSLTIQKPGKAGVIIIGYRPYNVLLDAIKEVAPELSPTRIAEDADAYKDFWGNVTERELQVLEVAEEHY